MRDDVGAAAVMMTARFDTGAVLVPVVGWWLMRRQWRLAAAVTASAALPVRFTRWSPTSHGWPPLPASVLLLHRLSGASLSSPREVADAAGYGGVAILLGTPAFMALTFAALALLAVGLRGDTSEEARDGRVLLAIFLVAEIVHFEGSRSGEPYLFRYEAYLVPLGVVVDRRGAGARARRAWRPRRGRSKDGRRRRSASSWCCSRWSRAA